MPVQETLETKRQYLKNQLPEMFVPVRREDFQKFMKYYKDKDNPGRPVPFYMYKLILKYHADDGKTLEDGIDMDGLTKTFFTHLWRKCMTDFDNIVPLSVVCPPECKCDMFSKIVFHSYILNCQLPKYLPKRVVMGMFCDVDWVPDKFVDNIIETLILEQVPSVRNVLQFARTSGLNEENKQLLTSFVEVFFGRTNHPPPNKPDAFVKWLRALVFEACFNSPNHFVAAFRKLLKDSLGKSTPADATYMLKTLSPTRSDIITLLSPDMIRTSAETQAMTFLELFLNTCKEELLEEFLLFCTGSITLSEPSIGVSFTRSKGYPVASTCFNSIRIPTGYYSYSEFEETFLETLSNPEYFKFYRT